MHASRYGAAGDEKDTHVAVAGEERSVTARHGGTTDLGGALRN